MAIKVVQYAIKTNGYSVLKLTQLYINDKNTITIIENNSHAETSVYWAFQVTLTCFGTIFSK